MLGKKHGLGVTCITWPGGGALDTGVMDITHTTTTEARQPALWRSRVRGWAAAHRTPVSAPTSRRLPRPWPFVAAAAAPTAEDTPVVDGDEFLRRLREAGL